MKLFSTTIIFVGAASATLPPGYEDQIWCPDDTCEIYINPFKNYGARSFFSKCYNPAAEQINEGVWTGSLTDIVPPDDYIKPNMCTAAEWSQCDTDDDCSLEITPSCACYASSYFHPFDPCQVLDPSKCDADTCSNEECDEYKPTCSPGLDGEGGTCEMDWIDIDDSSNDVESPTPAPDATDKIPAQCDSNEQCYAKIRSRAPSGDITGVGLCGCYAASSLDPFDECEGRGDACSIARCRASSCDEKEAYCDIAPDDNGMGECKVGSTSKSVKVA